MAIRILCTAIFLLMLGSCGIEPPPATLSEYSVAPPRQAPGFCAGVRGNGNFIFAHFGSLARILEEFGEIDGMAGGSSASISTFLYESMRQNSAVPASGAERQRTLALLTKSAYGLAVLGSHSQEAEALRGLAQVGQKIRDKKLLGMVTVNWHRAGRELKKILENPEIRGLINPEALKMLANIDRSGYRHYRTKVRDLLLTASAARGLQANDAGVFFREPIVNYDEFTTLMGRIGNFYAGVDPVTNAQLFRFVHACLAQSKGRTWHQLAEIQAQEGRCDNLLSQAVRTYFTRLAAGEIKLDPTKDRLMQAVGSSLTAFVPTAILDGKNAVATYEQNLRNYRDGAPATITVDFADVKFGYFTPYPAGDTVMAEMKRLFPDNAKVAKAINLNPARPVTWREAIRFSALEPGLSRVVTVAPDRAFIGGWADLHPTQILKAAGCDKIIYINRIGPETSFVTKQHSLLGLPQGERYGVAELLNMTHEDHRQLYWMDNPANAYNESIRIAHAVWCTDWDSSPKLDIGYMFDHSYGATPSMGETHPGHVAGIALESRNLPMFKVSDEVRVVKEPLWGCHAP